MKLVKSKKAKLDYDHEIDSLLKRLGELDQTETEYKAVVENLKTISEAKAAIEANGVHIDPNQIVKTAAYLIGLGVVLKYEELRVITGKAFGLLSKFL